jgi:hypothetical protein
MRLTDILELAARQGVSQYVQKRAGVLLPMAVGAMIPGIVNKAMERAHSTEHALNHNSYNPMKLSAFSLPPWLTQPFGQARTNAGSVGRMLGADRILSAPGSGVASGLSNAVERKLFGQAFGDRRDMASMAGQQAVGGAAGAFGKEMGSAGAKLLLDMANKAMESVGHAGDASAREAVLGELKRTDPVLANADDKTLMEAYHTMTRFAPVLSTDKNAVRSFLRQAVMSGSGPDFHSIKLLADSERAVTGEKDKR